MLSSIKICTNIEMQNIIDMDYNCVYQVQEILSKPNFLFFWLED